MSKVLYNWRGWGGTFKGFGRGENCFPELGAGGRAKPPSWLKTGSSGGYPYPESSAERGRCGLSSPSQ